MFFKKKEKKKKPAFPNLLTLATIGSIVVTSLKLGMKGMLSVEALGVILILSMFIIAMDNPYLKILTVAMSIFVFASGYSSNSEELKIVIAYILALIIMLFGVYIIFKGLFGKR